MHAQNGASGAANAVPSACAPPGNGIRPRALAAMLLVSSCAKLLFLAPSGYVSTDFEVHRNWMAVTANLPLARWYYDETSMWTLDYPPMFAFFERALALAARHVAPEALDLRRDAPAAYPRSTLYMMRLSVIAGDAVLVLATFFATRHLGSAADRLIAIALVLSNAGLLLIDHVHFQYNGMLLGILLFATSLLHTKGNREAFSLRNACLAACVYAFLLTMKHLYIVLAPAFAMHLLLASKKGANLVSWLARLTCIAFWTFIPPILAFAPFAVQDFNSIAQIARRLVPVHERGLLHAYWAPNFWALWAGSDLALWRAKKYLNPALEIVRPNTFLGLTGNATFAVLPNITPQVCAAVSLAACVIGLRRRNLVQSVVNCALAAFLFGWHVHEKAILTALIPLALIACTSEHMARIYFLLSVITSASMIPLIGPLHETLMCWTLCIASAATAWVSLKSKFPFLRLRVFQKGYLFGILLLEVFRVAMALFPRTQHLFLPLALVSCYNALGVLCCWLTFIFLG